MIPEVSSIKATVTESVELVWKFEDIFMSFPIEMPALVTTQDSLHKDDIKKQNKVEFKSLKFHQLRKKTDFVQKTINGTVNWVGRC